MDRAVSPAVPRLTGNIPGDGERARRTRRRTPAGDPATRILVRPAAARPEQDQP